MHRQPALYMHEADQLFKFSAIPAKTLCQWCFIDLDQLPAVVMLNNSFHSNIQEHRIVQKLSQPILVGTAHRKRDGVKDSQTLSPCLQTVLMPIEQIPSQRGQCTHPLRGSVAGIVFAGIGVLITS